jgi:methyl-accepting chemotaxis protein
MAESTTSALNGILLNVTKVVDLVGEIASASDDQSHSIESVAVAMNQVSENAQAGSQQSSEVASAAVSSSGARWKSCWSTCAASTLARRRRMARCSRASARSWWSRSRRC